jgi:hypothetical protein
MVRSEQPFRWTVCLDPPFVAVTARGGLGDLDAKTAGILVY